MKNIIITLTTIGLLSPIVVFAVDPAIVKSDTTLNQVHIRSLAASCAACHGTKGKAAPGPLATGSFKTATLAGVDKNYIANKLMDYKSGAITASVMHRHAKGLTDEEITALADYFSALPATAAARLNPQKLRADHAY